MRVKILSCFNDEWWHERYIGEEVEVIEWSHDAWFALAVEEHGGVLPKRDCKVVKGDNKMSECSLVEVIEIINKYPAKEFVAETNGGRRFEAKMLHGHELYITEEGLSECMIPTSTIPLYLKWKQK